LIALVLLCASIFNGMFCGCVPIFSSAIPPVEIEMVEAVLS
jgi:hypothetical protein